MVSAEVLVLQSPFADFCGILLVSIWLLREMLGCSNSLPALQSAAGDCTGTRSPSKCGGNAWRLSDGNRRPSQAHPKSSNQRVAQIAKPRVEPPRGKTGWNLVGKPSENWSSCHFKYSRLSSSLKDAAVWVLITRGCPCAHLDKARGCA